MKKVIFQEPMHSTIFIDSIHQGHVILVFSKNDDRLGAIIFHNATEDLQNHMQIGWYVQVLVCSNYRKHYSNVRDALAYFSTSSFDFYIAE